MVKICLLSSKHSGSNLLRLMLGSHNQISALPAPHIVNNLGRYIHLYGDLENPKNLEELVDDMLSLIKIYPYSWKYKFTVKDIINKIQQTSFCSILNYLYTLNAELE